VSRADPVLEAIPLRLLGVLVLLTGIAMLAARTPILVSCTVVASAACLLTRRSVATRGLVTRRAVGEPRSVVVPLRARALPAPLALTKAGVARLIA
jgi:hypothetical protein